MLYRAQTRKGGFIASFPAVLVPDARGHVEEVVAMAKRPRLVGFLDNLRRTWAANSEGTANYQGKSAL